ncbi:hypothetical protein ACEPPN_018736 [Leptodophora sp. 'Broadleaf-Isolate-01']
MPSPGSPIRRKKPAPKTVADMAPPTPQASDDAKEIGSEEAPKIMKKKKPAPPLSEPESHAPEAHNAPGPNQATTNSSRRGSKFDETLVPAPQRPVTASESEHDEEEPEEDHVSIPMERNDDSGDHDGDQSEEQSDNEEDHDRDDGASVGSPLGTIVDAGSSKQTQEFASGLPDHAQKRVNKSSKDANGVADAIKETANTATPQATSTAGPAIGTVKGPAPDLRESGSGDALGRVKDTIGGVGELAGKAAGDVQDQAASAVYHVQDTEQSVTGDATKTVDNGTRKPAEIATGATEQLGGLTNGATHIGENANKQGEHYGAGVAKQMTNDAENSKSAPGHDSENTADEARKSHRKETGDLKSMTGRTVNGAGEIVYDSGMAIGKVNGVASAAEDEVSKTEAKQDEHQVSRRGDSEAASVSGIEIKVETNPAGTTLTIKIPGAFQHQ